MTKLITVLVGSLRKNSYHKIIAENYPKLYPDVEFKVFQELDKIPYYNLDLHEQYGWPAEVVEITESIKKSDAIIFLTPEYNYSLPAVLKNAIDWISRNKEYPMSGKKVGMQCGTGSLSGGVRMQTHLRQILVYLDCIVINKPEVALRSIAQGIDVETREITSEDFKRVIRAQIDKLLL